MPCRLDWSSADAPRCWRSVIPLPRHWPRLWHGAALFCAFTLLSSMCRWSCVTFNKRSPRIQVADLSRYGPPTGRPCSPGVPCTYHKQVDLRILVLTYNRPASLLKLLQSLQELELDGSTAALHIWVDRSKTSGQVDETTLDTAKEFDWRHGHTHVHVQEKHVGILGQWIDTWRPQPGSTEIALFLEDDISVSPHAWRWIKAAYRQYAGRKDVQGLTLQSENINVAIGGKPLRAPATHTAFLYRLMGSWGFVPQPEVWSDFLNWYHFVRRKFPSFKPFIGRGIVMDSWYREFLKQGTQDNMWTMWFIHYTENMRGGLFCVYNNLHAYMGPGGNHSIAVNREEPGLHYGGKKGKDKNHLLLRVWQDTYVSFPQDVAMYDMDGSRIDQR